MSATMIDPFGVAVSNRPEKPSCCQSRAPVAAGPFAATWTVVSSISKSAGNREQHGFGQSRGLTVRVVQELSRVQVDNVRFVVSPIGQYDSVVARAPRQRRRSQWLSCPRGHVHRCCRSPPFDGRRPNAASTMTTESGPVNNPTGAANGMRCDHCSSPLDAVSDVKPRSSPHPLSGAPSRS